MKTRQCDILIIGAGPAGASAAKAAAQEGASVLVVEKRRVIGLPVQCAEYIPAQLVGVLSLGHEFIVQNIRHMETFYQGRMIKKTIAPGYTIRRDLFDHALAKAAQSSGATFLLSTRAERIIDGNVVVKVKDRAEELITATVIIGADGPFSKVGQWMGSENKNLMPVIQKQMRLCRACDVTEIHFDPKFYGGYGWLFPKGEYANVGLGLARDHRREIVKSLEYFIDELVKAGKIENHPAKPCTGWIPAEHPRKIVKNNLMLVGDAAGHTHAITGAGVPQAVICGEMAGRWAAKAVKKNEIGLLDRYEAEWREYFEQSLSLACSRRTYMEDNWNLLDNIIERCWVGFKEYYADAY